MSELQQPINVPISDRYYRLVEDYVYTWGKGDFQYRITVPAGFVYDGASVPRLVWTVSGIRPDGLIRAAALVHDWIYHYRGLPPQGSHQFLDGDGQWKDVFGRWRRRDVDRLFARIMREAGVSKFKRRMAYRAVRWFGWLAWRR